MNGTASRHTSLSALLGTQVTGAGDRARIAELLLDVAEASMHVASVVLTPSGRMRGNATSVVAVHNLRFTDSRHLALSSGARTSQLALTPTTVRLEHDLLDQQIIDVDGHKVVRVNDVDLVWEMDGDQARGLRVVEVEVGLRGAVRRLLKGLPASAVEAVSARFATRVIPWRFVDLIDRDPARRVRLKVGGDRLSGMHPSDIADILEELAPAERDAVFTSLDEETAAEAREEVEPKLQRSLLEGMDSTRVAGIVEEMDPGAAADLLSELSDERSDAILKNMDSEGREEIQELLEFPDDSAAGQMTTDYIALPVEATVGAAIDAMRAYEGDVEVITEIYLVDAGGQLRGVVNLARIVMAGTGAMLREISEKRVHTCHVEDRSAEVAELFDKYNLRSLPVLDDHGALSGVIYAEHVIAVLRERR